MSEPVDLDGIEARARAATPGPWHVDGPFWVDPPGVTPTEMTVETRAGVSGADRALVMEGTWGSKDADAAHIAGMDPATTLALVAEVRALRAKVAAVEVDRLEVKREALREARYHATWPVATAEKWRYDRMLWVFGIMLGEIAEGTPAPPSPSEPGFSEAYPYEARARAMVS